MLLPFKLITVFLHEASHATACKLTCGKVCNGLLPSGGSTAFIGLSACSGPLVPASEIHHVSTLYVFSICCCFINNVSCTLTLRS